MSYKRKGCVLSLGFNQDHGCFTCCMESGLKIYNIEPLAVKQYLKKDAVGSVGHSEMLFRSNIIAIVGGGEAPKYTDHTVLIWDDLSGKFILEYKFSDRILNVKLRREKLIVVLRNIIHVFSFPYLSTKLFSMETCENFRGLCDVSSSSNSERQLLVFPYKSIDKTSIQLVDLKLTEQATSSSPIIIQAHRNPVACITLNQSSTMVATASTNGTLIRIFDTKKLTLLYEFRRGSDPANIYCINFNADSDYICCSSDKGTIHIFALKDSHLNRKSTFSMIGLPGPYASSLWNFRSFTVTAECACICAFGTRSSVYAVCVDGTFHKYNFYNDRPCTRDIYDEFLDVCDDNDC